jgi:hypothetical protein
MKARKINVDFVIEDWTGTCEELDDAILDFEARHGITLTCIGMSGDLTGKAG